MEEELLVENVDDREFLSIHPELPESKKNRIQRFK